MKYLHWLFVQLTGEDALAEQSERAERLARAEELTEGYPDLAAVLAAISGDDTLPQKGVRRLVVTTLSTGEASVQVTRHGMDEPEIGYYSPEQLG